MAYRKTFSSTDRLSVTDQPHNEEATLRPQLTCAEAERHNSRRSEGLELSIPDLFELLLHVADKNNNHTADCPSREPGLKEELRELYQQETADDD